MVHLLDRHPVRVVLYVKQNRSNFPAMRFATPAHVFIAGQAARERIRRKLIGFDESQLVEVGRPQADVHATGAVLPRDGRTVRECRAAHHEVLRLLHSANAADAGAQHLADTPGPFGWQVDAAGVCDTDISAVANDWLATAKPLVVTRPNQPRAAEIVAAAVRHPDDAHAALLQRYVGDTTHGASMDRFLAACSAVIAQREAALVARGSVVEVRTSRPPWSAG